MTVTYFILSQREDAPDTGAGVLCLPPFSSSSKVCHSFSVSSLVSDRLHVSLLSASQSHLSDTTRSPLSPLRNPAGGEDRTSECQDLREQALGFVVVTAIHAEVEASFFLTAALQYLRL